MTNPDCDLLGDPIPEPLPENIQLISWDELKGHTIKAVIDCCVGKRHADVVFVTASNCFLAAYAEADGCCGDDGADLKIVRKPYSGEAVVLHDFVSADTLHAYECITASEREHLRGVEDERKKKQAIEQAARLRAQAERAEREAGLVPAQSSNGST